MQEDPAAIAIYERDEFSRSLEISRKVYAIMNCTNFSILLLTEHFQRVTVVYVILVNNLRTKREYAQRAQTSAEHGMTQLVSNMEDPDFGLGTPGSEA